MPRLLIVVIALSLARGVTPSWLEAQGDDQPLPCPQCLEVPDWVGEFAVLSGNAILGGLTAGIGQRLSGGSFRDGFTRGFLGGTMLYAGKRVAVEDFDGAGLLGRQVGAVGSSVVANAAAGRPSFDRLMFAVGPVRLHVQPADGWRVRPALDANAALMTLYAAAEPRLHMDLGASLSAGAPVFEVDEALMVKPFSDEESSGMELGFNVLLSSIDRYGPEYHRRVFAHERVHVLQGDFLFLALSRPLVDGLVHRFGDGVPGLRHVARHVDVDVGDLAVGLLEVTAFGVYHDRPWELEAEWLGRR